MKKLNIKSFLINHTEKLVFGLFALISLLVLRSTEWSSKVKSPFELKEEIRKVKNRIEDPANVWPDQASYKVVNFSDKSKELFSRISTDHYLFSTTLYHPLNKVDEPRREPIYEAVQALTAKAALVTLNVRLETTPSPSTVDQKEVATNTPPAVTDAEFAARGTTAPATGGNTTAGNGPPAKITMGSKIFGEAKDNYGDRERERDARAERRGGSASGPRAMPVGNAARGYRVVAVRGVFPLKQQLDNYQKALHITESEAIRDFEIADFVLERQIAKEGPDPWKNSDWRQVSIENAFEVLQEASVQDPDDPVPLSMKDQVITMELPWKLTGYWGDLATHPKIKDQLLGTAEIENQNLLLDTLDETASESKLSDAPKQRRRGMALIQNDMKGIAQQIRIDDRVTERLNRNLNQRRQNRGDGKMNFNMDISGTRVVDYLINEKKNYLLFRYLDFDVQSGLAYRYRVRLILRNPNFEIAPEKLGGADPNIANGAERPTNWSNISDVALVPATVEYFLENVGRDPYRETKYKPSEAIPVAMLSIFNYETKFGTWVTTNSLKISNIGAYIGDDKIEEEKPKKNDKKKEEKEEPKDEKKDGKKASEKRNEHKILDLALGGLINKKYFFSTQDVLVDVEADAEIDPADHPELKFEMEKRPDRTVNVKLKEDALVSTTLGELKTLDSITQIPEKELLSDRVKRERAPYKEVEIKKAEPTDPFNQPRRRFRQRGMGGGRGGRERERS